jgi:hypothetical protein
MLVLRAALVTADGQVQANSEIGKLVVDARCVNIIFGIGLAILWWP